VPEKIRGRVGSVQTALCSFFSAISYILGLVWSAPETFTVVVVISYGGVLMALMCFATFYLGRGRSMEFS
jgi:iron-regulated transporter 1